jgi:hypothetical protein
MKLAPWKTVIGPELESGSKALQFGTDEVIIR